jgi:tetratricopeptide (TPR) repeat protein
VEPSISGTQAAALINQAILLHQQGEPWEALAAYEQILSAYPSNFDAHYNRGKVLQELKRSDEALVSYDEALHIDPCNADVYNQRGIVLKELGRHGDALESCGRAITLKPDFAEAYCNRGNALGNLRRFEDALASYDRAIFLNPDHAEGHYKRGLSLQLLQRYEDAVASYDQAIFLKSDYAESYNSRGTALVCLGNVEEGIVSFRNAIRIDPRNIQSYCNLGHALAIQGNLEEVVVNYHQALNVNPSVAQVHHDLGNALMLLGRLDEAKASYYQSLKLNPNDETYFNLHPLLLDPHDMSPAIQCLESALKLQSANNTYKFFLGMLLDYSGRVESADAYFKDVQQGSNFDKARLDAWNYIKSVGMPRMVGSSIEALRLGIAAAPSSGLVLEFGVRFGVSIRQIAGLVDHGQQVHGFDSFEGLPEAWHQEAKGAYSTNEAIPEVPDNVRLYKGWFENTLPEFVKTHKEPVRFVNIDCDLYSSTRTVLDCLSSQVIPGTVIVFDEYIGNEYWREDEFKAFQEAVGAYGWKYEYLAFSMFTKQVVLLIV